MRPSSLLLLPLLMAALFTPGLANAQLAQGCISVNGTAVLRGLIPTTDGGCALASWWSSGGLNYVDQEIIKLDADGAYQWGQHFNGGNVEYATCIAQSADGGYVIAGYTRSFGAGGYDFLLTKVDANGALQWSSTAGTASDEYAYGVTTTSDGGYAVTGQLAHVLGDWNGYVARFDAEGTFLWGREYHLGPTAKAEAHSIVEAPNGHLIVAGFILDFDNGGFVLDVDTIGELHWCKKGLLAGAYYAVTRAMDDGFVVAGGNAGSAGAGGTLDMCVMKLDTLGEVEWGTAIGAANTEQAWAVTAAPDSGYVIAGEWDLNDTVRPYLAKVDKDGDLLWTRILGDGASGYARALMTTSDGGLLLGGNGGNPLGGMLVSKMDANGMPCPSCGVDSAGVSFPGVDLMDITNEVSTMTAGVGGTATLTATPIGEASAICTSTAIKDEAAPSEKPLIFPQPAADHAQLLLPNAPRSATRPAYTIHDGLGRLVRMHAITDQRTDLDLHTLPAGLYRLSVLEDGRVRSTSPLLIE